MRRPALIAILLLLTGAASAQGPFNGRIKGTVTTEVLRGPVEGAKVDAQAAGVLKSGAAQTDIAGRFEIDLGRLFPGLKLDGRTIVLIFSKQGYVQNVKHWDWISGAPAEHYDLKVSMTPLVGGAALTPDEKAKLNRYRREGRYLYLLPYKITAAPGSSSVSSVNMETLANALSRAIRTHLQTLPKAGSPAFQVGILPIDIEVAGTDMERIRLYGTDLKALAIVSGYGSVERTGSGKDVANISSQYYTLPSLPEFAPVVLDIDDTLPAELLNSPKLHEKLTGHWGTYTLFAVSLREFEEAKAGRDRARVERVRAYLMDELAQLGPEEQLKMKEIVELIKLIDQELRKP